jgi:inhibitor of KinA sporulation pathway (predicted exonuclease)
LTTRTQADVDGGVPLARARQILVNEYETQARMWASYGDYDRKQFERNCGELGIPYSFGPTHLNVKTLAAVVYGWSREVGMGEALKRMGLPLEGAHQRGGDDAWNHILSEVEGIAAILSRVLRSRRVGCVEPGSRA